MSDNALTEMLQCFNNHACDKGFKHGYQKVYEKDFVKLKDKEINILEIGVDTGASLGVWYDYFPKANIYGLDLFVRNKLEDLEYFKKDRIYGLKSDSTKPSSKYEAGQAWKGIKFDIIIDDGMHTPDANLKTFKNFFPLLKEDGSYYIEDVFPMDIMTTKELNYHWIVRHPERYSFPLYDSFLREIEKHKVSRYDLRKEAYPDSYIIKVTK
tara:strand:- start:1225 stop:1857 length:633 start_codon:yes stop_codon:yes gene_type:complete